MFILCWMWLRSEFQGYYTHRWIQKVHACAIYYLVLLLHEDVKRGFEQLNDSRSCS